MVAQDLVPLSSTLPNLRATSEGLTSHRHVMGPQNITRYVQTEFRLLCGCCYGNVVFLLRSSASGLIVKKYLIIGYLSKRINRWDGV